MEEYPDFHGDQSIDSSSMTDSKKQITALSFIDESTNDYKIISIKPTITSHIFSKEKQVAITKGCPNKGGQCFCPGTCKEIIGYRDKLPGEY